MDSSIPPLTPFTSYSEWKLKMIAYLKRRGFYEVSIGIGRETYENENDWLNDGDRSFGSIALALDDDLSCIHWFFIDEHPPFIGLFT